MAKKSSASETTENALLGTIRREFDQKLTTSSLIASQNIPPHETVPAAVPADNPEKSSTGKATVLWFHPEDKRRIQELVAFLASQGVARIPNNSLVIKSVLRAVQMDDRLLAAYEDAVQADRRLKKYKAQS
jgi:hypothetical protein